MCALKFLGNRRFRQEVLTKRTGDSLETTEEPIKEPTESKPLSGPRAENDGLGIKNNLGPSVKNDPHMTCSVEAESHVWVVFVSIPKRIVRANRLFQRYDRQRQILFLT